MIKIRKGVFETNSSSMHSVAIVGANKMLVNRLYENENEKIVVNPREYGWNGNNLTSPIEKLSYITTMIQYKNIDSDTENSIYFEWLSEMVKDYTGLELIYQKQNDEYYPNGYIDHQSVDTLDSFWSDNEDEFKTNMKDLVFNEKYFIIIDNDNG